MNEKEVNNMSAEAYKDGLKDGIVMYAHWKNGVQYVGTTGKTLKKALEEIENDTNSR